MATEAQLKRLSKRGINARKAYACCRNGSLRHGQALLQLVDTVEDWFNSTEVQANVITLPRGSPIETAVLNVRYGHYPTVFQIAPGGSLAWQDLLPDLPQDLPELERLRRFVGKAVSVGERDRDTCYRCITRNMWGQKKHRKRGIWKGKTETNKMMIRVPHK